MSLTERERRPVPVAAITIAVLVGLAAVGVLFVWDGGTLVSNAISLSDLEDSEFGVVYLEEHNVFVVASDDGPLALLDDAQHAAGDRVRYCPSSGLFEGPRFGATFDREGRYVGGPAQTDLDRVAVEVTESVIAVDTDLVIAATERSRFADAATGGKCTGLADDPGFMSAGRQHLQAQARFGWVIEGAEIMPNGVHGVTRAGPEPLFEYMLLGEELRFVPAFEAPAEPPRDLLEDQPFDSLYHVGTLKGTGNRVFIYQEDGFFCVAVERRNGLSGSCNGDIQPGLEWGGSLGPEGGQILFPHLPKEAAVVTLSIEGLATWTQRPLAGIAVFDLPAPVNPDQATTATAIDAEGETIATTQLDIPE